MTHVDFDSANGTTTYRLTLSAEAFAAPIPEKQKRSRQQAKADRIAQKAEADQRLAKMGGWK